MSDLGIDELAAKADKWGLSVPELRRALDLATRYSRIVEACFDHWIDVEGICPFCEYSRGQRGHDETCELVANGIVEQSGERADIATAVREAGLTGAR